MKDNLPMSENEKDEEALEVSIVLSSFQHNTNQQHSNIIVPRSVPG